MYTPAALTPHALGPLCTAAAGSADEGGLPRYKHYTEAEKVVEALTELGHLNLTGG